MWLLSKKLSVYKTFQRTFYSDPEVHFSWIWKCHFKFGKACENIMKHTRVGQPELDNLQYHCTAELQRAALLATYLIQHTPVLQPCIVNSQHAHIYKKKVHVHCSLGIGSQFYSFFSTLISNNSSDPHRLFYPKWENQVLPDILLKSLFVFFYLKFRACRMNGAGEWGWMGIKFHPFIRMGMNGDE